MSADSKTPDSSPGDKTFHEHLHDQFDAVYSKVTQGRRDLKTLKAYLDDRAQAEKEYAAGLVKSAQKQPDFGCDAKNPKQTKENPYNTSLSPAWKDARDSAANLSKQHEQFGNMCTEVSGHVQKLIVEAKSQKTKLKETYHKHLDDVKTKTAKHDKCKESYYEAVKTAETALLNRDSGRQQQLPDKKIAALELKVKSALKDVEVQHNSYKTAVDQLQQAQTAYDAKIIEIMTDFERMERSRSKFVCEQLDRFAVAHDFFKSSIEQIALVLHRSVDAVNTPKDIQEFIKLHDAGTKPKEHVQYIPRKSQIIDHALEHKSSTPSAPTSGSSKNLSPPPPFNSSVPHANSPSKSTSGVLHSASSIPPPFVPPHRASTTGQATAIALYDFDSTEADDLPFKVGQIINLLSCDDADDWWQGESNGKQGIFPKNYVQKQALGARVSAAAPAHTPAPHITHGAGNNTADAADAEAPKVMDAKCVALFDFEGQDADELTFKTGQHLVITGELNGWYLGKRDGDSKVGIFPANYVKIS